MKFKKSTDKSNKTELPVIGGDAKDMGKKSDSNTNNKPIIKNTAKMVLILLGFLILVSVTYFIYTKNTQEKPADVNVQTQEVYTQTSNLAHKGEVESALNVIDKAIDTTDNEGDKQYYLLQKYNILYNNKDYNTALQLALELDKTYSGFTTKIMIADCYKGLGDKQKALDNYNLAIDLIPKNAPDIDPQYEQKLIQSYIKDLENI